MKKNGINKTHPFDYPLCELCYNLETQKLFLKPFDGSPSDQTNSMRIFRNENNERYLHVCLCNQDIISKGQKPIPVWIPIDEYFKLKLEIIDKNEIEPNQEWLYKDHKEMAAADAIINNIRRKQARAAKERYAMQQTQSTEIHQDAMIQF